MRRDVDSVKWFELGIYGSPVAATGGPYHLFMALKLGMHAQRIANARMLIVSPDKCQWTGSDYNPHEERESNNCVLKSISKDNG